MEKISIIVPVYKTEKFIKRCIDSILEQTYLNFELILVDDGSPDNCGKICDEYAEKDNRIIVIHQENGGLSAARNAAIDWLSINSNSGWITFVDSDDWISPFYLEYLMRAAVEKKVDISICNFKKTKGTYEEYFTSFDMIQEFSAEDFDLYNHVLSTIAWGKLYKRSCFSHLRFPIGRFYEDGYTTYKLLYSYERFAYIDCQLYYYYINENSIMQTKRTLKKIKDGLRAQQLQRRFFKKNSFFKVYPKCLSRYLYDINSMIEYKINNSFFKFPVKYLLLRDITLLELLKYDKKYSLYMLEEAHPIILKIYWILANKIKRILKRDT